VIEGNQSKSVDAGCPLKFQPYDSGPTFVPVGAMVKARRAAT